MDIIKAVVPAAGIGTRFFPFTKTIPKEMLPVLNKPAIQYNIEEGVYSGINNFFMIISKGKHAIADHFDNNMELEIFLKEHGKLELLNTLNTITHNTIFNYIRQPEPQGLGHAVWMAHHLIGKEYFAVMLPDEIIISKTPALSHLMKIARQEKASVIAVQEMPTELLPHYGVIGIKKQITPNLFQVSHMVEKPDHKDVPSNMAIVGRYILSHKIFNSLESIEADQHGELQLTDAIVHMMRNNEKVFAYKIPGIRYDIGNPLGWLKANIGCALQDPYYEPLITKFLSDKQIMETFIYNPSKISEHQL